MDYMKGGIASQAFKRGEYFKKGLRRFEPSYVEFYDILFVGKVF